ncbi:FkbM family methyltransferase [Polynucleobacter sphagniphilus]|nr:FkbM family methyltransferase [Polynucleobacter sphagniphilus]
MYYALCGTVALNDLENLFVFNQGLGAHPGRVSVPKQNYSAPADFGTLSLVGESLNTQGTIEIVRIDDLNLPKLDFLKIDVEGMELDVLRGGSKTIKHGRPWCWVEYHKIDRNELILFFSQMDYVLFAMDALNVLCG